MKKIRVLIIDDSALVRKLLTEILNSDPQIEVVGSAADPLFARDKIKELSPDVLTLDVEMPRMDGVTFLNNLMRLRPMPVVMISSLTEAGADVTLKALEIGAVDFVEKPKMDVQRGLEAYTEEIVNKVKAAARARVRAKPQRGDVPKKHSADAVLAKHAGFRLKTTEKIIAIGASTGGTEAVREVLEQFPAGSPAVVVVQHIPESFSRSFADRLNTSCAMKVSEATDGQRIMPGHVYIAPGNCHLVVKRSGADYICVLNDGPPVNRHRPSVDVLFRSVAQYAGANAIGTILTGMGNDGAAGLKEMLDAGARTYAQDEKTCVVYGMPKEAVLAGGVETVLPLDKIAGSIFNELEKEGVTNRV